MDRRIELGNILKTIPGVRATYFQPPESVKLEYPCIIYRLRNIDTIFANNYPYKNRDGYEITIIDRNPDSDIHNYVKKMQLCRFDRYYTSDNLNHWIFVLYY